jgi:hypothetical protein
MNKIFSSFKDPSGFVFTHEGKIYRQINRCYQENYEFLKQSGLYQKLVDLKALIPHEEVILPPEEDGAYKIIEPLQIPFISYPYEWCFSQLKDAALLTLRIQKEALNLRMSLKDASSFNIQFFAGRPIFIDTLSFEKYEEGKPWVAYKQFCEHFLAPLALIAYSDDRLGKLAQLNIDGIPLDLAAKILPFKARFRPALFLHIFLHARSQKHYSSSSLKSETKNSHFNKNALLGLIDNLESGLKNLKWRGDKTIWTDYYQTDNQKNENCVSYEDKSLNAKKNLVADYLDKANTAKLWDIGANAGMFSRVAAAKGIAVIAMDYDPTVVEQNYLQVRNNDEKNILPLLIDVINPTPALGWHNREREAILERPLPDTVLALALIHHLAIGNNLPFVKIAEFFAAIAGSLIIEFVPKSDRQAQLLLQSREDIFADYNLEKFEADFGKFFMIKEKSGMANSDRLIYLMVRK